MASTPTLADWHPERLAARLPFLAARGRLTAATRAHFSARGYTEVETPALVPSPGAEVHLAAFETEFRPHLGAGVARRLFLRTSPELAIKRLLAGGAGPVFELARVWRNGEISRRHAPEFTMLEWYRPGLAMAGMMDEAEAYLRGYLAGLPAARPHHRRAKPSTAGATGWTSWRPRDRAGCRAARPMKAGRTASSACCCNGWNRT